MKVREKLKASCKELADSVWFRDCLSFVVESRSSAGYHLDGLRTFVGAFVKPKLRRLPYSAYGLVSRLPNRFLHVKFAFIKKGYNANLDKYSDESGKLNFLDQKALKYDSKDVKQNSALARLERALEYFHQRLNPLLLEQPQKVYDPVPFLGTLDVELSATYFQKDTTEDFEEVLGRHFKKWEKVFATAKLPMPRPGFAIIKSDDSLVPAKDVALAPKILSIVAGRATNAQDEKHAGIEEDEERSILN